MQTFVMISNVRIMINADVSAKNWFTKVYVMTDLFGILVYENDSERLQEQARINIENYLTMKKNIERQYIDIKICMKKINKD